MGDATRVENLRLLARELGVQGQVRFVVNASFPDMLGWLARASIGLGTMVDEHFGINIVEFMVSPFVAKRYSLEADAASVGCWRDCRCACVGRAVARYCRPAQRRANGVPRHLIRDVRRGISYGAHVTARSRCCNAYEGADMGRSEVLCGGVREGVGRERMETVVVGLWLVRCGSFEAR